MGVWGSNKQFQIYRFQEIWKIGLSCVGTFYRASAVLTNAQTL